MRKLIFSVFIGLCVVIFLRSINSELIEIDNAFNSQQKLILCTEQLKIDSTRIYILQKQCEIKDSIINALNLKENGNVEN